jgi:hypothetical protein
MTGEGEKTDDRRRGEGRMTGERGMTGERRIGTVMLGFLSGPESGIVERRHEPDGVATPSCPVY